MTPPKKKKFTITASEEGVETAEKALLRLGFESKSNFAKSQLISRSVVTKFFNYQPVQLDTFKRICEGLKLNWRDIAGLEEDQLRKGKKTDCSSLKTQKEVEQVQTLIRSVTVVDESTQTVKVEITLKGDIYSVDNLKTLELILRQYSGDTVKITDIQEGSIKLTVEGSQDEINKLLEQIQSGELTEVDGFPIEDVRILSESSDNEESKESVDKWSLVEEIMSQPIQNRDLRGIDLSDTDLRGINLRSSNLSGADLSGSDLSGANLSRTNFNEATLIGANLSQADLIGANLSKTNLIGANLSKTNLSEATLIRANLGQADIRGTNLSVTDLSEATLIGANLSRARLKGSNLSRANFNEAILIAANLNESTLSKAKLIRAKLIGAKLIGTDLSGASFRETDVSGADFSTATLIGADFSKIRVTTTTKFSSNSLGMTEELKQYLIKRGAIVKDSLKGELTPDEFVHKYSGKTRPNLNELTV